MLAIILIYAFYLVIVLLYHVTAKLCILETHRSQVTIFWSTSMETSSESLSPKFSLNCIYWVNASVWPFKIHPWKINPQYVAPRVLEPYQYATVPNWCITEAPREPETPVNQRPPWTRSPKVIWRFNRGPLWIEAPPQAIEAPNLFNVINMRPPTNLRVLNETPQSHDRP